MKNLVIIGTGLFAQLARDYFDEFTEYEVKAFACHEQFKNTDDLHGLPLESVEDLLEKRPPDLYDVFVAIGYGQMNRMRERVFNELEGWGYSCASFVHPGIKLWPTTDIGRNVFIFEDNTIQPYTSIGNNTVLWSGNHIGHHTSIGSHCFIASHAVISGSCEIGDNVFIGVNASLHDGITVARETLIGAGAVVSKDTEPKDVYAQPGTKVFKKKSDEIKF